MEGSHYLCVHFSISIFSIVYLITVYVWIYLYLSLILKSRDPLFTVQHLLGPILNGIDYFQYTL